VADQPHDQPQPSRIRAAEALAFIGTVPNGSAAEGPLWRDTLQVVWAVTSDERRIAAEAAAPKFGVSAERVLEAARTLAEEASNATDLNARVSAVTKDTPAEEITAICTTLAALGNEVAREKLTQALIEHSGLKAKTIRDTIKAETAKLKREAKSAAAEAAAHAKTQRICEIFPNFPGPEEMTFPPKYYVNRQTGAVYHESDLGTELVMPKLTVPIAKYLNLTTGEVQLLCAVWRDSNWALMLEDRERWFDHRKIVSLANRDVPIDSYHAKNASKFIAECEIYNWSVLPIRKFVRSLGWHTHADKLVFALPGRVLGLSDGDDPLEIRGADAGDDQVMSAVTTGGTWEGWLALFDFATEHCAVAPLVVYAALASPLLARIGVPGGILHLCGTTSRGKTTLLQLAASTCGRPGGAGMSSGPGLIVDWSGTLTSKERLFGLYRHLPVFVDENRMARAEDVASAAYMLANGTGKSRGSIRGLQSLARWQLMGISTGERTMAEAAKMGGLQVRAIDLWLDGENTSFDTSDSALRVRQLVGEHYGHLMPRFVDALLQKSDAFLAETHRNAVTRLAAHLADHGGVGTAAAEMVARLSALWAAIMMAGEIFYQDVRSGKPDLTEYVGWWFRRTLATLPPRHSHTDAYEELMAEIVARSREMLGSPAADGKPLNGWIGKWEVEARVRARGKDDRVGRYALLPTWLRDWLARRGYPVDGVLRAWRDEGVLVCNKAASLTSVVNFDGEKRLLFLLKKPESSVLEEPTR